MQISKGENSNERLNKEEEQPMSYGGEELPNKKSSKAL